MKKKKTKNKCLKISLRNSFVFFCFLLFFQVIDIWARTLLFQTQFLWAITFLWSSFSVENVKKRPKDGSEIDLKEKNRLWAERLWANRSLDRRLRRIRSLQTLTACPLMPDLGIVRISAGINGFPLPKKRNENEELERLSLERDQLIVHMGSSFVFISFFLEKESNFFSFIIFLWTIKP